MDLGILNTVIAMVIVLLVLSLLVQSVQILLKKLLKLKSKQIEDSLKDLFDQAIAEATSPAVNENNPATASAAGEGIGTKIRNNARLIIVGKSDTASEGAEKFANKVLAEFQKIGRVTKYGRTVLESLSKEDLFKVMAKFESEDFFPGYAQRFREVCQQILALRSAVETLSANEALRGSASAKLAQIRAVMAPIFNNVEAILDGEQVKPKVLFADLLRLRQLDINGVLNLLDEAQQAITQESVAAAQTGQDLAPLDAISKALAEIAELIGELSKKFDEAVSPLRRKLEQVEVWFDTVTQSFDERYARHMKTVSLYISIVMVILLNANFFQIYKSLSSNEVQRNLITEAGAGIVERAKQAQVVAQASSSPGATASPTPNLKAQIEESRQAIESLVATYEGFGFPPLTGEQFNAFLWSTGGWTAVTTDPYGNPGWLGFRPAKNDKGLIVN